MKKTNLRRLLAFAAATGLAASLAACGHQNARQNQAAAPLATAPAAQPGWSMDDLAAVDPAYVDNKTAPLPQAVPMKASYSGRYADAPSYDYGPQPYDGSYTGSVGPDDYQWLALASSLGGMLGDAPPDYAFAYDGVQPWAWETGDRYLRYAEPIDGGYRYYYYEPDSARPFLISDPYYSYGYRDDRLVTIYDRSGRLIDADRAARERQAAQNYFARAQQMYAAAHRERRLAVAASLWDRHQAEVTAQQRQWDHARRQRLAWQRWDAQNEQRLHRDWANEALVRREAERSFAGWRKADFKTPPPRFYSPQQRQAQLQKVAAIRHSPQFAAQQRARQNERQRQLAVLQRQAQQQRVAQQRQLVAQHQQKAVQQQALQQARLAQRQSAIRPQHQQQVQRVARQRVAQAQQAKAQQAQRLAVRQRQAQQQAQQRARQVSQHKQLAQREAQKRQQAQHASQQRQQQASRKAAQHRQQAQTAARAHQQQAQRAAQQRQAQHAAQQRQAQHAAQQRQAQHAAQQRQAQARQVAQRQAQQARSAQQHRQAQAEHAAQQRQAAQHKAQQARPAQQQRGKDRKDKGHGRGQG
jgi:hypothetical protein